MTKSKKVYLNKIEFTSSVKHILIESPGNHRNDIDQKHVVTDEIPVSKD